MIRKLILPIITTLFFIIWISAGAVQGQDESTPQIAFQISPTAQRLQFPTSTPLPTLGDPPTQAPPTFTPTEPGPPQLQALPDTSEINVRAEADINSDIVGTIRPGEQFIVTGRLFRWLRIRFEPSPTGSAFVYDELVEIIGDPAAIPDLTESLQPTTDSSAADATGTASVLILTPGFDLTQTADVREIEAPSGEIEVLPQTTDTEDVILLPTFTYPPNIPTGVPAVPTSAQITTTPDPTRINLDVSNGLAPIVPIVILLSLGLIGLLISLVLR